MPDQVERPVRMSTHQRTISAIVFSALAISTIAASSPAFADPLSVRRGKAFAQANCSYCHSIDRSTRSPRRAAPPFRTLHKQYPVETLGDVLAEGMSTGHPRMPEFRLDSGQVADFISFLKSLE
jgi:mono/diheme cytochrome c family protein